MGGLNFGPRNEFVAFGQSGNIPTTSTELNTVPVTPYFPPPLILSLLRRYAGIRARRIRHGLRQTPG